MEIRVEILSRNLVKPSSPTPQHLRDYKLCLLDQFIPEFHAGIVFFYSSSPSNCTTEAKNSYSFRLKNSLSDTLTDFYPIAGRFKDTATIDCNDEGACFVETGINCDLCRFLTNDVVDGNIAKLVPCLDSETMKLASNCMLIAQLTIFECGGVAVSFCLQHRYCDLSSVVTFLRSWSARARPSSVDQIGEIFLPDFSAASLFLPPRDLPSLPAVKNPVEDLTTIRLVFEASKISDLKARFRELSSNDNSKIVENSFGAVGLSRIEVALALILKCAVSASRSISPSPSRSVLFQSVNLRKRTKPPLPENSIGNLFWMLPTVIEGSNEVKFHEVASKLRRATTAFFDEIVHKIRGEEGASLVFESVKERGEILESVGDMDVYWCSSWCRFPLYEMDFCWGKPAWVSSGVLLSRNLIVFEDTKCGTGIQAWVTLDPRVMAIFENDEELLSFASLRSSAHDLA